MKNENARPRLGIYEKAISNNLSWEEKFSLAWESGYDFLELSIDATEPRMSRLYGSKFAHTINRAMNTTGFKVQTMALTANRNYPLGSEDDAIRNKGLELVQRAIAVAGETNVRVIHLAAYDDHGEKRNQRTMERFKEAVRMCADAAESANVMLALETMDKDSFCSVRNMVKLLDEVASPFMQCYADIGNITATGFDPAEEFAIGRGRIVGMHLKDATPGVCRDIVFGEGIVDFDAGLSALSKTGYRGPFVAEMWSYDNEAAHAQLSPACDFLRNKLNKYFI